MRNSFAFVLALLLAANLTFAQTSGTESKASQKVELNPQPEPPGKSKAKTTKKGAGNNGEKVTFNPQPDPPVAKQGANTKTAGGSKVALNPQPEPPGVQG